MSWFALSPKWASFAVCACAGAELPVLRREHGAEGARALADGPHTARGARPGQRDRRCRPALALRARRALHSAGRQDARRARHLVLLVSLSVFNITLSFDSWFMSNWSLTSDFYWLWLIYSKRWPTQSERSGPCNRVTPDWACGEAAEQAAAAGVPASVAAGWRQRAASPVTATDVSLKRGHVRHHLFRSTRNWWAIRNREHRVPPATLSAAVGEHDSTSTFTCFLIFPHWSLFTNHHSSLTETVLLPTLRLSLYRWSPMRLLSRLLEWFSDLSTNKSTHVVAFTSLLLLNILKRTSKLTLWLFYCIMYFSFASF